MYTQYPNLLQKHNETKKVKKKTPPRLKMVKKKKEVTQKTPAVKTDIDKWNTLLKTHDLAYR
jgi:hypothetical protein